MNAQVNGNKRDYTRYSFEDLRRECEGQWPSIVTALSNVDVSEALSRKTKHVRCHRDHGMTKKQFRLFPDFDQTGGGVCNTCGTFADGFSLFEYLNGWDRKTAVREVANYLRDRGYHPQKYRKPPAPAPIARKALVINKDHASALQKVWSESLPLNGTVAEKYLRSRGIDGELPNSGDVGFHPRLHYWDGDNEKSLGHFPAMVSILRSTQSGHPLSIHRIYLDSKGRKANVPECKKLMPCSVDGAISEMGAAVRLYNLEGDEVAITEGLETAMAVRSAHPHLPVWAAFSAQVLTNFVPPASVKRVYIFGDVDASGTGQVASTRLALKLEAMGIEAKLCLPAKELSLPGHNSGWYTKQEPLTAIMKRVQQGGYGMAMTSPNVDWLDVWQVSRETVINAIHGPVTTH